MLVGRSDFYMTEIGVEINLKSVKIRPPLRGADRKVSKLCSLKVKKKSIHSNSPSLQANATGCSPCKVTCISVFLSISAFTLSNSHPTVRVLYTFPSPFTLTPPAVLELALLVSLLLEVAVVPVFDLYLSGSNTIFKNLKNHEDAFLTSAEKCILGLYCPKF